MSPAIAKLLLVSLVLASSVFLGGCQAVKDIFEVGFGVGVFVVLGILALAGGLFAFVRSRT